MFLIYDFAKNKLIPSALIFFLIPISFKFDFTWWNLSTAFLAYLYNLKLEEIYLKLT